MSERLNNSSTHNFNEKNQNNNKSVELLILFNPLFEYKSGHIVNASHIHLTLKYEDKLKIISVADNSYRKIGF